MIPYGYPRISYLLHYQNDKNHQKKIKDALNVDRTKPILLYAPTWHATKDSTELMSISPELIEEYHVIFKGHIEDDMTLPEGAIEAPNHIETQDLLLISDVVITDYSSIIFDALTIGKKVCLYTPNHSSYQQERGVYDDVMESLSKVWYTDEDLLHNNLIHHTLTDISKHQLVNRNNTSLKTNSTYARYYQNN